jgi:hypothetical protein
MSALTQQADESIDKWPLQALLEDERDPMHKPFLPPHSLAHGKIVEHDIVDRLL